MEQLAIPLSNHKTVAKWLVIRQQAAKSLVIAMTALAGLPLHIDVILLNQAIRRQQGQPVSDSLANQHAVKWIIVQRCHREAAGRGDPAISNRACGACNDDMGGCSGRLLSS